MKSPSALPTSTERVLDSWLATAKSGLPSALKSPTATDAGPAPAAMSPPSGGLAKLTAAVASAGGARSTAANRVDASQDDETDAAHDDLH